MVKAHARSSVWSLTSLWQVWVIAETGEIFTDYEKYLKRYAHTTVSSNVDRC
jgi:hypothetical protein